MRKELLVHSRRAFHSASQGNQFFPQIPTGQRIKRFYKKVDIIEHPLSGQAKTLPKGEKVTLNNLSLSDKYWAVTLDNKVIKTIYKDDLLLPTKALAVSLAEEWESQHESINLKSLYIVSI